MLARVAVNFLEHFESISAEMHRPAGRVNQADILRTLGGLAFVTGEWPGEGGSGHQVIALGPHPFALRVHFQP